MRKVQWNVRLDYEFLPNYKLLQKGFLAAGIAKRIEVERLMKGRYQENLEFCQFMMYYYMRELRPRSDVKPYDPVARRKLSGCPCFPDWATIPEEPTLARRVVRLPSTRASTVSLSESDAEADQDIELIKAQRERDFYFGKLGKLEKLIKSGVTDSEALLDALYSTQELDITPVKPRRAPAVEHHCLSPGI